jgi:RNA polymerase sigma-70 factor (ECF subfamily)
MNDEQSAGRTGIDFDDLVSSHYEALYRFAFSLTRSEADAADLTQQTFLIWAEKGSQLKDPAKVKTWLFTTLHRTFLGMRRRQIRFPHLELSEAEAELPQLPPSTSHGPDMDEILRAFKQLNEGCQAALALFYLEDYPYNEIAEILEVPLGTVKSRIARGLNQLHQLFVVDAFHTAPQMPALPTLRQ